MLLIISVNSCQIRPHSSPLLSPTPPPYHLSLDLCGTKGTNGLSFHIVKTPIFKYLMSFSEIEMHLVLKLADIFTLWSAFLQM